MATGDYIAKFNPRSIRRKQPYMYRDLVPGGGTKAKAAQAAAIVAGVPAAREVALANLGSGAEAAYPMQPDVYGGQDTDPTSPGPAQIIDPNAPQNIPSQRESTPIIGTEQQEAIANQGRGARYDSDSIMGLISSLAGTPKANEAFDSTKPIGGENVPYQPAGIFQRFLGNQANMLNLGAQQTQGEEWKAEGAKEKERLAKREDLAEEIRLREAGPAERFKITQTAAEKAEAARVAAENKRLELENKRLELEGKRIGLTEQQIADARQDRIDRLRGEQEERAARIEDMRTRNALADAAFGRSMLPTAQAISTGQGGVLMYDPRSGQPIGTFSSPTIGEITDPKTGKKTFGPTGGGYKPYTPPVKAPVNTGGAQVNRVDGSTMGGPLPPDAGAATPAPQVTPPRSGNWPAIGEVKPDVSGLYYTAEPFGSGGSSLKETGAFDVPPSVAKQMSAYAMSPEQKMNILKNYQQGLRASRSGIPRFAE